MNTVSSEIARPATARVARDAEVFARSVAEPCAPRGAVPAKARDGMSATLCAARPVRRIVAALAVAFAVALALVGCGGGGSPSESARTALQSGDLNAAVADFDTALEASPDDASLHLDRGVALHALGRYPEATEAFTRALEIQSDLQEAFLNRSASNLAAGDTAAALEDVNRALELAPEDPAAFRNRALVWLATDELDAAFVDITSAMELSAFDAELFAERALIEYARGFETEAMLDETIYLATRDMEENGPSVASLLDRALAWLAIDEPESANDDLTAAAALEPENGEIHLAFADVAIYEDRLDDALAAYDAAAADASAANDARLGRAYVQGIRGDCAAAVADYDAVIAADPTSLPARGSLAALLVECPDEAARDADRALGLVREILAEDPARAEDWAIRELAAIVHAARGDRKNALAELDAALALTEDEPAITAELQELRTEYADL